jgi:hypothetical protein
MSVCFVKRLLRYRSAADYNPKHQRCCLHIYHLALPDSQLNITNITIPPIVFLWQRLNRPVMQSSSALQWRAAPYLSWDTLPR